jgi:hypothetical protein
MFIAIQLTSPLIFHILRYNGTTKHQMMSSIFKDETLIGDVVGYK